MRYAIVLLQCPYHGTRTLALEGDASSGRFTAPKCCGAWAEEKVWPVTERDLRHIAALCNGAAYSLQAAAGKAVTP